MKARIKYYGVGEFNPNFGDGYAVEINTGDGWGLDTFYECRVIKQQDDDAEPEFIHFSILQKINHLMELGYQVELLGRKIKKG